MNISELKKLTKGELQNSFIAYLQKYRDDLDVESIKTYKTDAFYLYNNGFESEFWVLLDSDDWTFESSVHGMVNDALEINSKKPFDKSRVGGYVTSLTLFRDYIASCRK